MIARQLEKCNSMTDLSHDRNARHLEEMTTQFFAIFSKYLRYLHQSLLWRSQICAKLIKTFYKNSVYKKGLVIEKKIASTHSCRLNSYNTLFDPPLIAIHGMRS